MDARDMDHPTNSGASGGGLEYQNSEASQGGRCGGGGGSRMSKNLRNSLLFGTWLDWGCGLQAMYICSTIIYALG